MISLEYAQVELFDMEKVLAHQKLGEVSEACLQILNRISCKQGSRIPPNINVQDWLPPVGLSEEFVVIFISLVDVHCQYRGTRSNL